MSFDKYKPEVWNAKIHDDLDKTLVFKENCNHSYEGDAKKPGDAVRILVAGDVTVDAWHDGHLHQLRAPEEVNGSSIYMPINEIRYFNFFVDDLDKAQAQGGSGLLSKYTSKVKDNLADEIDKFIAKMHVDEVAKAYETAPVLSYDPANANYILDAIDKAYLMLLENDVTRNTKVTLTVPPQFTMMLKRAYVELDTDNSEMLKNGRVGRWGGIELKESNNCFKDENGIYHLQLKTDEAIAFVNPYTHTEGYRPDDYFRDGVKGYTLFDGKVVFPKQCIDLNVKLA